MEKNTKFFSVMMVDFMVFRTRQTSNYIFSARFLTFSGNQGKSGAQVDSK